jgi:hypothetical protein
MRLQRFTTPAALVLAITMAATTAFAQNGNEGRRRSRDKANREAASDQSSNGSRGEVAVRRSAPRDDSARASGAVAGRASDTRGYSTGASGMPGNTNRGTSNRGTDNRQYDNPGASSGAYANRGSDNRPYDNRGYANGGNPNRGYDNGRYDNRGYPNHVPGYGRYGTYNRNAWRGRVHVGLGISIFPGSPFSFHFGYGWRPSFAYHYPMSYGAVYGGMSFLLNPDYAEVYVDGNYVGVARDFGGQPVPVAVGYHRIELYAEGFAPVAFDVTVRPGQVIPYRGSLYPAY